MIRIGLQIAHLLNDLKGRIAVAIAFQNIMLIISAFIMVVIIHLFTHNSINELFLGASPRRYESNSFSSYSYWC